MEARTVCVTGAGGYIASWIVAYLLKRGYKVHGTVRDLGNDTKYGHLMALDGASERLTLFKADLLDQETLVPAIRGCHGVFHTACPVSMSFDHNPDEVLLPAIKGTENVLRVCNQEKISRVIFTSSGVAMVADPKRPKDQVIDENCWSDPEYCRETKQWYMLAKTEAEKLAWKYSKEHNMDMVAVLPVLVFGPMLQTSLNTSMQLMQKIANGSMQSYPNSYYPIVDVRDTAEVHVRAFEDPKASGRYFCLAKVVHYGEIVEAVKKNFPHLRCPKECEGEIKGEGERSYKKVRELLPEFIPFEKTVVDTIQCLIKNKFLPRE